VMVMFMVDRSMVVQGNDWWMREMDGEAMEVCVFISTLLLDLSG